MEPERQEYEEEFEERRRFQGEAEREFALREEMLMELAGEQERLKSGAREEELEQEREMGRRRRAEARNERAIKSGNLEELIQEEKLERKAARVREELKSELGLKQAVSRAPVFLLAAAKRAETERLFKERAFNALVRKELDSRRIKGAIEKAGFKRGELAVDKERAIAVLHGDRGRALLDALRAA